MALTYNVMPLPKFFFVDTNGAPYAGGSLTFYASGSTTPQDSYSDAIGTPNLNPLTLDSAGRATVYLAPKAYSIVLKDSAGVTIWTIDPVFGYALTSDYGLCGGRLTLTTGVPVTSSDVTGASAATIFFTPYTGGAIALFDGTSVWGAFTFNEISIAVPAVANQMYDVFASQTAGVVALSLVAWTSDTARATNITLQNGVYVKSGGTTFRYLGSFRTTAVAGQTEDSLAKRHVWNWCNQKARPLRVTDLTNSWTYSLAPYQQARASTANQLGVVVGVQEVPVEIEVDAQFSDGSGAAQCYIGIGENSTTVNKVGALNSKNNSYAAGSLNQLTAMLKTMAPLGYTFYVWLEGSATGGTTTWYGDDGGVITQSGIQGLVYG